MGKMVSIQGNTAARLLAAAVTALALEGCASQPMEYAAMPPQHGRAEVRPGNGSTLNCVPFARDNSSVKIFGDAVTWWDQAGGHYARTEAPTLGSVMVLHNYAGPKHGHLAVVRTLVNSREIRVDHANWLNDGAVYINDPVVDVSQGNDWSQVRVWNIPNNAWGSRVYAVQGFIGPGRDVSGGALAQNGGIGGPVALAPGQ
jgi:hypothetical protein